MAPSIWQLLLVVLVVFVIFGAGKLPRVMEDLGKGIRNFRDGVKGDANSDGGDKKLEEKSNN